MEGGRGDAVTYTEFRELRNAIPRVTPVESREVANQRINEWRGDVFRLGQPCTVRLKGVPNFSAAFHLRLDVFGYIVSYCADVHSMLAFHVDHIIPLVRGGRTEMANLTLMQGKMNIIKKDRCLGEILTSFSELDDQVVASEYQGWTKHRLERQWALCYDELMQRDRSRGEIVWAAQLFWKCLMSHMPKHVESRLQSSRRPFYPFREAIQELLATTRNLLADIGGVCAPDMASASAGAGAGAGEKDGSVSARSRGRSRSRSRSPSPADRLVKIRTNITLPNSASASACACQDEGVAMKIMKTERKGAKTRYEVRPTRIVLGTQRARFKVNKEWVEEC